MIAALACAWALAAAPSSVPPAPAPQRAASATVQGQLRSAGLRAPVGGATVVATARDRSWTRRTTSSSDGEFFLGDLPTRDFVLTIVAVGHERLEQPTTAKFWSGRRPPLIYLQPSGAGQYRTIVASNRETRPSPVSVRLAPAEVATLPGSQGDPLRALQNLPGSARIPGGLGLLVLRGATPNQSQVYLGEHPIPRAFHVPGLASVLPGGALAGIEYVPGNFDSSYGNAVGGIVALTPRKGRRDGVHGTAKLDLAAAGALVEGPMGKGSFLMAAQRGYLDLALRALPPEASTNFLLPRYYDYQVIFDHPIGPGATVTTRFIGAGDNLRYPARGVAGDNGLGSTFHRIDLSLRKRLPGWDFLLAPAVRLDQSRVFSPDKLLRRSDIVALLRAELTARVTRRFDLTVGADTQIDRYAVRDFVAMTRYDPEVERTSRGVASNSGLYVTPMLTLRRVVVSPGVRVNAFTGATSQAYSVDPRLIVRWTPHRRVSLGAGAGQYSQPAVYRQRAGTLGVFIQGAEAALPAGMNSVAILPGAVRYLDPQLQFDPKSRVGVSQALQLSANIHVDITDTLGIDATAFFRRVRDGLPPVDSSIDYYFGGSGGADTGSSTHGIEAMLRQQLTRRVYGWIAYTWMRSQKGQFADRALTDRAPADFDQRHNLVFVVNVKLPRRWELGGRFRVVTGLPYTPIVGAVYDETNQNDTAPIFGASNSARLGVFHQLDLRVDRTWVLRRCIVAAYFDVQNIYNRQNPEGVIYSIAPTTARAAVGVPILPVLGMRVEY